MKKCKCKKIGFKDINYVSIGDWSVPKHSICKGIIAGNKFFEEIK